MGTVSGAALHVAGQGCPPFPAEAAAPAMGRPEAGTSSLAQVWRRAMSSWCVRSPLPFPAVLWCRDHTGRVDTLAGSHGVHTQRLSSRASGYQTQRLSFLQKALRNCGLACPWKTLCKGGPLSCSTLPAPQQQSGPAVPLFDLQGRGGSRTTGGRRLPHAGCNERTIWLPSGCFLARLTFPAHLLPIRPLRARPRPPLLPGVLTAVGPLPCEQQGPAPCPPRSCSGGRNKTGMVTAVSQGPVRGLRCTPVFIFPGDPDRAT